MYHAENHFGFMLHEKKAKNPSHQIKLYFAQWQDNAHTYARWYKLA